MTSSVAETTSEGPPIRMDCQYSGGRFFILMGSLSAQSPAGMMPLQSKPRSPTDEAQPTPASVEVSCPSGERETQSMGRMPK
jgi:hypothetical protein